MLHCSHSAPPPRPASGRPDGLLIFWTLELIPGLELYTTEPGVGCVTASVRVLVAWARLLLSKKGEGGKASYMLSIFFA